MKSKTSEFGQNLQKMLKEMLETGMTTSETDEHAAPCHDLKGSGALAAVAAPKEGQPPRDPQPHQRPESCAVNSAGGTSASQQN